MNLNELLVEMDRIPISNLRANSSKDYKAVASLEDIKQTLKNTNLKNIEIEQDQPKRVYFPIGNEPEKYVYANKSLNLKCKNHKKEKLSASANELNNMITAFDGKQEKKMMNPCPTANRYNKSGKQENANIKNSKELSDEDSDYKDVKYGAFDSKEEAFFFRILKNYLKKNPLTKSWQVLPKDGYGEKFKFKEPEVGLDGKGQHKDADVYIKYSGKASKAFNGFKGMAFLIDGITHYSPLAPQALFLNDTSRNKSKKNHVVRLHVYDIDNLKTGNIEKKNIINFIHTTIDKLVESIPHEVDKLNNAKIKEPQKTVRSTGEREAGNVLYRETKKDLNKYSLQDLIQHLQARENSMIYGKNDDKYESEKYGVETLVNREKKEKRPIYRLSYFLTGSNALPSRFIGKKSYDDNTEEWNKIFGMSSEDLADWKEKHQAKNGERLFSTDSEGNIKLFENKN